ncbi:MAG TPA: hypothetical protein VJN94_15305 [Candidatus Binataceae bacterium]|nr:hypothetical protein [Candidatus Binataceae bacterium]
MRFAKLISPVFVAAMGVGLCGCWQQYPTPAPSLYQQFSSMPAPKEYPGVRELMNAPATDPALNNSRDDLRP